MAKSIVNKDGLKIEKDKYYLVCNTEVVRIVKVQNKQKALVHGTKSVGFNWYVNIDKLTSVKP